MTLTDQRHHLLTPTEDPVVPNPNPNLAADASPRRHSAMLSRWSRARNLRSGRHLEVHSAGAVPSPPVSPSTPLGTKIHAVVDEEVPDHPLLEDGESDGEKVIYMVSDGTGSTLEHALGTTLGQFENRRTCPIKTHLFSGINDVDHLIEITKSAAKEGALLLCTLANPALAEAAPQACRLWNVPFVDILGPTTEAIASHIGMEPSGIPRCERRTPLSAEYFSRIEAIEFTIKQDDGACPHSLNQAHIVIVGVSRSGKTPLSIYLAQKGYKVANVPIVMGVNLPKPLFQISQDKVYALDINPAALHSIRTTRATSLGFSGQMRSHYSGIDHVRQELDFANKIYSSNPLWPVIDVTGKAIEEVAAVVMRIYHDRKQKGTVPGIVKRY